MKPDELKKILEERMTLQVEDINNLLGIEYDNVIKYYQHYLTRFRMIERIIRHKGNPHIYRIYTYRDYDNEFKIIYDIATNIIRIGYRTTKSIYLIQNLIRAVEQKIFNVNMMIKRNLNNYDRDVYIPNEKENNIIYDVDIKDDISELNETTLNLLINSNPYDRFKYYDKYYIYDLEVHHKPHLLEWIQSDIQKLKAIKRLQDNYRYKITFYPTEEKNLCDGEGYTLKYETERRYYYNIYLSVKLLNGKNITLIRLIKILEGLVK